MIENESEVPFVEPVDPNIIDFVPPIKVNNDIIPGDMLVKMAVITPQNDTAQVVAAIYGDGRTIGVPFIDSNENSIRVALS